MSGRLINKIKYIYLSNDNDFKKLSLNDNVYFTLRDIFWNAISTDTCFQANEFNRLLTCGIVLEDRTESFFYNNLLHQKDYVKKLLLWLNSFQKIGWFKCVELDELEGGGKEIINNKYMKFDNWFQQFEELRRLIGEQYKKML